MYRVVQLNTPVAHTAHAIAVSSRLFRVCAHDNGNTQLRVDPLKILHDLQTEASVQITGRLICQEQFWLRYDCPGDRNTLLLSAGKLRGDLMALFGNSHHPQRLKLFLRESAAVHMHSLFFLRKNKKSVKIARIPKTICTSSGLSLFTFVNFLQ